MKCLISWIILICFVLVGLTGPYEAGAQESFSLPAAGVLVHLSPEFTPAHLQGITIHPDNGLRFDFLIQKGSRVLDSDQKREEYKRLVKYFMASLTIPDEDQWVTY